VIKKRVLLLVGMALLAVGVLLVGSLWAQETKETVTQEIEVPFTCETPVAMTAPGLSPEISIVKLLAKRLNLEIKTDPLLKPEALNGFKTLIIIIGGSGKGLGAAGIDIQEEAERAKKLIAVCKEKNIRIIGMHLGGKTRRGANSAIMIDTVTKHCDYVVVRADGNEDGIFTKICSENKIPLTEIKKTLQVNDVLKELFQLK